MPEVSEDGVCVTFRLTRAEYRAGILALCWRLWFYRAFAALIVIAVIGSVVGALAGNGSVALTTAAVAVVWILFFAWILFGRPVLQYRRQPRLSQQQTHCFSDGGITVSLPDAESQVKWTFFDVCIERDNLYLIRHQKRFANIIPRRAFGSQQQELRFRQLAQQHLKLRR